MLGDYFEGEKNERFERWIKKIVGQDDRYKHLLSPECEDERLDFYAYFSRGVSPWRALQEEYRKYA